MKPFLAIWYCFISIFTTAQERFDVVIHEIMCDPSPSIRLPNNEWIELRNTSTRPINLQGWRIADVSGQTGPLPDFTLLPDSMVIICTGSAVAAMSTFGTTIGVGSFPSLDNDGEAIFIKDLSGKTIHAIEYNSNWHQNEVKKQGGWSLEMIDSKNPCTGKANWTSTNNAAGGTPGKVNSIAGSVVDDTPPKLLHAFVADSSRITLVFDEALDSTTAATPAHYSITDGIAVRQAICVAPLFDRVELQVNPALAENKIYTITAVDIIDCKQNVIEANNSTRVGIPTTPMPGQWIINEILFNPKSNGYDYIEFLNNSDKIFDASQLSIANRNSNGDIGSITALTEMPLLIFPQDHIVLTEKADMLALHFLVKNPQHLFSISSLPSYPDAEGTVVTLDYTGAVLDELRYSEKWHFKLIDNPEGIALERINPDAISQLENNWHSAASTAGYGTPTYQNSQYKQINLVDVAISIVPTIFSPDGDGRDDIVSIQYKMTEPNFVANIIIFDAAGRPVKNLVRNGTMALEGYWNWDGLGDKGQQLPIGTYVVYTEVFTLNGKKQQFKNAVVLARKMS